MEVQLCNGLKKKPQHIRDSHKKTIICLTHHLDNSWKPTSWHSFQFKSNNILLIISDLISGQILMGSYLALVKKSN